jgi:hypothetical protein
MRSSSDGASELDNTSIVMWRIVTPVFYFDNYSKGKEI